MEFKNFLKAEKDINKHELFFFFLKSLFKKTLLLLNLWIVINISTLDYNRSNSVTALKLFDALNGLNKIVKETFAQNSL
jgi:hypothetical protein